MKSDEGISLGNYLRNGAVGADYPAEIMADLLAACSVVGNQKELELGFLTSVWITGVNKVFACFLYQLKNFIERVDIFTNLGYVFFHTILPLLRLSAVAGPAAEAAEPKIKEKCYCA